jgi:hypothetical protein
MRGRETGYSGSFGLAHWKIGRLDYFEPPKLRRLDFLVNETKLEGWIFLDFQKLRRLDFLAANRTARSRKGGGWIFFQQIIGRGTRN